MSLTVAMIVRDEASRIAASLSSARPIADQIVVVDSGSKDDTPRIARELGAIVVPFEWCDDFAAARNAAIPFINQRWTLWLDADEFVDLETIDQLPDMLSRNDVSGYTVIRRDFVNGFKPGGPRGEYTPSLVLRLLRNDLGIRFTGRCHEQLDPELLQTLRIRDGMRTYNSPLTLDHDCDYYFEGRRRKASRNGRLLEMEVLERPDRLYWMIQCAATLIEHPDSRERGRAVMRDALKIIVAQKHLPTPPMTMVELAIEYAALAPESENMPLSPDEAYELAIRWFPNAAPTVWLRACRAYRNNDFEGAIPILRRLIHMGKTHTYDIHVPFDAAIVGDDARLNLGACLLRIAELDDAENVLREINPTGPRGEEAQMNLAMIQSIREQFPEN